MLAGFPATTSPARPAFPMAQYVYTMIRVSKVVPPKRTIIKNI